MWEQNLFFLSYSVDRLFNWKNNWLPLSLTKCEILIILSVEGIQLSLKLYPLCLVLSIRKVPKFFPRSKLYPAVHLAFEKIWHIFIQLHRCFAELLVLKEFTPLKQICQNCPPSSALCESSISLWSLKMNYLMENICSWNEEYSKCVNSWVTIRLVYYIYSFLLTIEVTGYSKKGWFGGWHYLQILTILSAGLYDGVGYHVKILLKTRLNVNKCLPRHGTDSTVCIRVGSVFCPVELQYYWDSHKNLSGRLVQ